MHDPVAATIAGYGQMHGSHVEARLPPKDARWRIHDAASAAATANLPRGTVVTFAVPGMDPLVAARHEARTNALLGECGCHLSALLLVAAVGSAAVFDALQWSFVRHAPITTIASELAVAFVASGIGRMAGRAHARHTLRKTMSAISDRIGGGND